MNIWIIIWFAAYTITAIYWWVTLVFVTGPAFTITSIVLAVLIIPLLVWEKKIMRASNEPQHHQQRGEES